MLQPVGIELTLNNMEWQAYVGAVNQRNFDIGYMGASGPYDDYENGLDNFRSDAGEGNFCGYSSKAFDDLFHRGATATDINERRELMQQAEKTLMADYPLVPLMFGTLNRLVNPKLTGMDYAIKVPQSRYLSFKE
jgi:ABC-type transport system substrate-binding protein